MKIRAVIRFGFSGLAALSVCLSSAAQNKPDAQNKTVVVPTLREEAAKNGYARKAPIIDYFGCCKDLDDLLQKSELIVRGRAVYENPRLSNDEMSVWTDYTIEVLEVYKQLGDNLAPGAKLVVSKLGGHLLVDGHPVQEDIRQSPGLPLNSPQLLFIDKCIPSGLCPALYLFGDNAAVSLENAKITCNKGQTISGTLHGYCGMPIGEFLAVVKQELAGVSSGEASK